MLPIDSMLYHLARSLKTPHIGEPDAVREEINLKTHKTRK